MARRKRNTAATDGGDFDLNAPRPGIETRDFAFQQPRLLEPIRSWSPDYSLGSEPLSPTSSVLSEEMEGRLSIFEARQLSKLESQFKVQIKQERERIWNTDSVMRQLAESGRTIASALDLDRRAREKVIERWVDQGIWRDDVDITRLLAEGDYRVWDVPWNHEIRSGPYSKALVEAWKYERSEPDTDNQRESTPIDLNNVVSDNWHPKSDAEKKKAAEFRAEQRKKNASRPLYQFVYQMGIERPYILKACADLATESLHDINTRAYNKVKDTWKKWGIWDDRWGMMPGMNWRHEREERERDEDDKTPSPVRGPSPDPNNTVIQEPSLPRKGKEAIRPTTERGSSSSKKRRTSEEEEQSSNAGDAPPESDRPRKKTTAATKKSSKAPQPQKPKGEGKVKGNATKKLESQSKANTKPKPSSQRPRRRPNVAQDAVVPPPRRSERIKQQKLPR
jgi:hypothetical protein